MPRCPLTSCTRAEGLLCAPALCWTLAPCTHAEEDSREFAERAVVLLVRDFGAAPSLPSSSFSPSSPPCLPFQEGLLLGLRSSGSCRQRRPLGPGWSSASPAFLGGHHGCLGPARLTSWHHLQVTPDRGAPDLLLASSCWVWGVGAAKLLS